MSDGINVTPGTGTTVLVGADVCTVNSVPNTYVPLGKLGFGLNESFVYVSASAGLPVAQQGTWNVGLSAGTNVIGHVIVDSAPTTAVTGTVAISGTVTVASIGGSVEISNDAGNPIPVSGTFWQATQPVSAAALPLPSGAATSAKQPALGSAGAASADVVTVQGVASMTALKVDGSGVTQPISGNVNSVPSGDVIEIGGTTYPVLKGIANITTTGLTSIQTGTGGKRIRVVKFNLSADAATNVNFAGSTSGAISSIKHLGGAGAAFGSGICNFGQFNDTGVGDNLQVNQSGTANIGIDFLYILI